MRYVVLLLGLIGAALTATLGFELQMDMAKDYVGTSLGFMRNPLFGVLLNDTALVLFLTAAYGVLGALLGYARCGPQGGVLLLVPVLIAGMMNPYTLAFTWLQAVAGVLCFFVRPLPIPALAIEEDDDDAE